MIQMDNVNKPCWLVIYFSTLFLATAFYSHFLCLWDPCSHTQSHLNFSSAHAAWRQLHCASGNLWIWLQVSEFVKPVETALVRDTYTDTHRRLEVFLFPFLYAISLPPNPSIYLSCTGYVSSCPCHVVHHPYPLPLRNSGTVIGTAAW